MEIADELNKNAEIEKIQELILGSLPLGVEIVNIIIALNNLSVHFTWALSEEPEEDDALE
jgi:hypothetical protein